MTVYNSRVNILIGLRRRLQRVMEKHVGSNWPEALKKINALVTWIREAENEY